MSEHTAEQPAVQRLERSRSDRMLVGVCGGLARYFGINPAFYRVGFVVLALIGGAGILIYLAAALVIPDEGKQDSIASAALRERRDHPLPLIGLGIAAVAAAVLLSRVSFWPRGDAAWVLVLIAGGAVFLFTRHRGAAPVPPAVEEGEEGTTAVVAPARRRRFWRPFLIVLGSLILTHERNGEVVGLKSFPPEDRPNPIIPFFAFRIMVGIGLIMIAVGLVGAVLWVTGRLYTSRWFLRTLVWVSPLGFLAVLAGWFTAEVGRQPWTVYGVLRTADAVSSVPGGSVLTSIILFVLVYGVVFGAGLYYMAKLVKRGPGETPVPEEEEADLSHRPMAAAGSP